MSDPSLWMPPFSSMNLWVCHHPGCPTKAVGVGGAQGLVAIGWYFRTGPAIYCPLHRPDPVAEHISPPVCERRETPCGICKGNAEADMWQDRIKAESGTK